MEATLGTLEHYSNEDRRRIADIIKGLGSWLVGIFGCAHKQMSRPFSRQGENYRVCIGCGAHRRFDPQTWDSRGPFYYKAANTSELLEINTNALRSV
jgi:hypothetical protein